MITTSYEIGDIVFLRVRNEPEAGMVTGIILRPGFHIYLVSWAEGCELSHYDIELTDKYMPEYMT